MKNSALHFSKYAIMLLLLINGSLLRAQENLIVASAAKLPSKEDAIITAGDLAEQLLKKDEGEEDEIPKLSFSG